MPYALEARRASVANTAGGQLAADLAAAQKQGTDLGTKVGVLESKLTALTTELAALRTSLTERTWTTLELINGWIPYGEGWPPPTMTKDAMGFVHLKGLAKKANGPANLTVFVLPSGYRPKHYIEIPVACAGSAPCELLIKPNGEAFFETGDNGWGSVDGVAFEAAP